MVLLSNDDAKDGNGTRKCGWCISGRRARHHTNAQSGEDPSRALCMMYIFGCRFVVFGRSVGGGLEVLAVVDMK